MPPKPFPFITDGLIGDVPTNFYPAADSERGVILHGTPGLLSFCALTNCTEIRGLWTWNNYLYTVARRGSESILFRISAAGVPAELGTITTSFTGPVWMLNNYTQLLIVDGVSGYVYIEATNNFEQISDADFPGAAAADYQDTYGLFIQPSSIYWFFSQSLDFLSYDALDSYAKEGSTDNVRGILSNQLQIYLGGIKTTEAWQDVGGDNTTANTPTFQRVPGGLMRYGWASAKAGCIFDNTAAWVTDQKQVVRISGNAPGIISTDMMGRALKKFATVSDVITFSYVDQEHSFLVVTLPIGNETWVYDAKTQLWHKRSSYLDSMTGYGRWRVNCYALFNDKHYGGDYSNGKIYEINTDYYDDNGKEIPGIIYAPEIDGGEQTISFPQVQVIMKAGVGTASGAGSDPYASLDYSEDGGDTWSIPRPRSMGKIGETKMRARWLRNGQGFKRMWRLTITAPVERKILGLDWGTPS